MNTRLFVSIGLLTLGLTACIGGIGGGDDSEPGSDDSPGGTDDSGGSQANGQCHITGKVTVQLYTYDQDGELKYISFQDAYGGEFPFGGVWVTSYVDDGSGGIGRYLSEQVFLNPSPAGDDFSLDVDLGAPGEVRLFGMLDYWNDRIIGEGEPKGIHPDALSCANGAEYSDADITILAPYYDFEGSGGGGGGGGGGPGGGGGGVGGGNGSGIGCDVDISGDVLITTTYGGGEVAAMLLDSVNGGPWNWDFADPQVSGGGAEASYSFSTCRQGVHNLVGCWDSDGNKLFDPSDTWGSYISSPDVDGNPITIGTTDLTGMDIQIPLGDGDSPWGLVPFVTLSGTVSIEDGAFDDLPTGSSVYVVALKFRPNGDIAVADLAAEAYDLDSWTWAQLTGETSKSWSINVPAGTIVYLWAYADTDGDGIVNESGDYVASGGVGNDNGSVPTGEISTSGHSLPLGTVGQ